MVGIPTSCSRMIYRMGEGGPSLGARILEQNRYTEYNAQVEDGAEEDLLGF